MACIHFVSVLKCLLVLVVAALLGRYLVAGLGLALGGGGGGGVVLGKCLGWFLCGMGGLGSSQHR